ncbi:MAG: ABC transporter ATP-binding protein, partial [Anaerolineae bacterium]|nr:ABC transporter ATP-binding protein [Anaerolineae bacterium]
VGMDPKELRDMRGPELGLIFQEPMTRLDPLQTIEKHFRETLRTHEPDLDDDEVRRRSLEALAGMGIPPTRFKQYPHEFSGGMRQRIMIALALVLNPKVLIADEPTTALDVVLQAPILNLLRELVRETDMALLLISHDLAVVADMADNITILRHGEVMEQGETAATLKHQRHPYTRQLAEASIHVPARPAAPPPSDPGPDALPLLAVENVVRDYPGRRTS